MNSSNKRQAKKRESLDDRWYERFRACAFEDYEYLNGDKAVRENQRNEFIQGKCENPTLDYPDLEKLDIEQKERDLLQLKKDILSQESNETIKQIYRWKINEKIAGLRMLKETKSGNDRRFLRYSKFIYGKPEKEIYDYTISQIKKIIDEKITDPNENVRKAAQRIFEELADSFQAEQPKISDLKNFMRESSESEDFSDAEYNAEEIKNAFEQALEKYKLSGWNVIVTEKGTAVSVS